MPELNQLTVSDGLRLLGERQITSREWVADCLVAIEADGPPSFDGRPDAVNAWVRVYADEAMETAARADAGSGGLLRGVPVGLKDLYAVAGKPLTASSRAVSLMPSRSCDMWERLEAAGAVLIGHLHTHECAAGGSTDQVGNPWDPSRTAGGSSGGSGAALAARHVPLATGTDTAGSLRIPSALCGTCTIKPARGALPLRGIFPLSISLDHPGPMARTVEDCAIAMEALTGTRLESDTTLRGARIAVSPRLGLVSAEPDVTDGFTRALEACRSLGAEVVEPPPPAATLDLGGDFIDVLATDMLGHHRHFGTDWSKLRRSTRELLEYADQRAMTGAEHAGTRWRRAELTAAWTDWFEEHRVDALIEPTVPITAPLRGHGYDHFFTEEAAAYIAFTHYWNWTGFPVVALPSAGGRPGLPVGVSLVAPELRVTERAAAVARALLD